MNKIINIINSKLNKLSYRLNQLSYSKKNIKFYYIEEINQLKNEIKDLRSQLIFYKNYNSEYTIDIHGGTLHFIRNYLDDLLYYKMNFHKKVKLITGKGQYILFNGVKKYLINENIIYTIENNNFIINLY